MGFDYSYDSDLTSKIVSTLLDTGTNGPTDIRMVMLRIVNLYPSILVCSRFQFLEKLGSGSGNIGNGAVFSRIGSGSSQSQESILLVIEGGGVLPLLLYAT